MKNGEDKSKRFKKITVGRRDLSVGDRLRSHPRSLLLLRFLRGERDVERLKYI